MPLRFEMISLVGRNPKKVGKYKEMGNVGQSKKKDGDKGGRYHHGDLRQALVDGALELIREGDVGALSLRALARKVGVSYAAPYHHFSDKAELLAELAIDGYQQLYAEMERYQNEQKNDPSSELLAAGRAYLFFAVSHPSHYRVMFSLAHADEHPKVRSVADLCFDRLLENTRAVVGPAQSDEATAKLANMIWATVHGAATLWNDGLMCSHLGTTDLDIYVEMTTGQLCDLVSAYAEKLQAT
ncbi:MAG: TetR/AcrR family transcriptional regulator [Kofleriaceae bacterium]|nr:TetR/AcrR family transcriptional regulator [Kofleriaceae bacterium]